MQYVYSQRYQSEFVGGSFGWEANSSVSKGIPDRNGICWGSCGPRFMQCVLIVVRLSSIAAIKIMIM